MEILHFVQDDRSFVVTVDLFSLIILFLDRIIIVEIIEILIVRILLLVIRKVLEGDITVLEFNRIRALGLDKKRIKHIPARFRLAFECHDDALDVGCVIEIYELVLSPLVAHLRSHIVDGTETEILEHTVTGRHIAGSIKCLKKHDLILREIHIGPHLLMETVQGSIRFHLIYSCKSLYARKGDSIFKYHRQLEQFFQKISLQTLWKRCQR